ncbi:MAG: D-alanyl-D-alanine carboxypeptidase [Leptolyngbyaceae cyanobacterium RM2_2_4]|nr:D-alanyl-D-alanine carboxypeptidase [Leptolyngbyaceae cyanobacterium SM1_4_3]NJN91363.1 D-alanyl-D-alanine carboxypeptidase [Leptolyngbyaceae cyanobacterium SL_5_14]NJO52615.1 D-alanyl-D-alanine carboxypeptidase [Leptolyngbyaceae cyanobacterium RM2_2_4]NJO67217.1 D-alanyl-D-alanine carboxypeptidase [Leptolyngbyaceae cyanobacterium RM1_405_57]
MNRVSLWLKSFTLTAVLLVAGSPIPSKASATVESPAILAQTNAVDIYVPPPEQRNNGICPDVLEPVINNIIDSPTFANGRWGVLVEPLNSSDVIYSRNSNQLLIPASNVKLLTTAAALQTFDPQDLNNSASLREIIRVTNLNSDNGYADNLLQRLGGPQAVRNLLTPLGIDPNGYRQVDGSGLSRANAATATTFVSVLKAMESANGGDLFYSSLPTGGVSGTLRNRFRNTSAQGRVHAKTGTLNGVRALSGYLDNPQYGQIVFSILVNQSNLSGETMIGAIDQVVLQLARLTPCE